MEIHNYEDRPYGNTTRYHAINSLYKSTISSILFPRSVYDWFIIWIILMMVVVIIYYIFYSEPKRFEIEDLNKYMRQRTIMPNINTYSSGCIRSDMVRDKDLLETL